MLGTGGANQEISLCSLLRPPAFPPASVHAMTEVYWFCFMFAGWFFVFSDFISLKDLCSAMDY